VGDFKALGAFLENSENFWFSGDFQNISEKLQN
jgi:hypothetical protein